MSKITDTFYVLEVRNNAAAWPGRTDIDTDWRLVMHGVRLFMTKGMAEAKVTRGMYSPYSTKIPAHEYRIIPVKLVEVTEDENKDNQVSIQKQGESVDSFRARCGITGTPA